MPENIEFLRTALIDMWVVAMNYLPRIGVAVLLIIVGIILADVLKTAMIRVIRLLKVDDMMEQIEVKALFERMGIHLDVAEFLGWLVKWFVIVMMLITVADTLGWDQITIFLSSVVEYIPNVLIAVVILLVGVIVGSGIENVIRGAVRAAKVKSAVFVAGIAKWSIVVFSFMAALVQLGIAEDLIKTLFTGFVAMIALAGGLAFGLGGKDHAKRVLEVLEEDLRKREEKDEE